MALLSLDNIIALRYYSCSMIKSFACKETEHIFNREFSKKLPVEIQRRAVRSLRFLNQADSLQDVAAVPAYRLEKLKGDRLGQYSIRINKQWRICFEWKDGDDHNVEVVDYH